MAGQLVTRALWLADRLRAWGLDVVEEPGWRARGKDSLSPLVVVVHHTASKPPAPVPSLGVVIKGRSDVPGPLCNVLVGRDCSVHVIASGVSNNAGAGTWDGVTGNRHTLGIEVENNGIGEPWSRPLYVTTLFVAAALAEGARVPVSNVIGHKEWTPRKIDPNFDMVKFRAEVARLLVPVPVEEDFMSRVLATGGPADKQGRVPHWYVHPDGGVEARNGAPFHGSLPGVGVTRKDVVGIIPRPGYAPADGYTLVCAECTVTGESPTYSFPV